MSHLRLCLPLMVLALPAPARAEGRCPAPTVQRGSGCRLLADAALAAPLVLPPQTRVDCRGHKLVPDGDNTLAILIHDATDVQVTNCRIEGFDFGVFVLRAKDRIVLADNEISVRVKGVTLYGSERVRIVDNTIRYSSGAGYGVGVWRGSHENVVRRNTLTGAPAPAGELHPDFPGPDINYAPTPGAVFAGTGIYLASSSLSLNQFIAAGILFQFPPDESGERGNVIADNDLELGSRSGPAGIQITGGAHGTVIRGNRVSVRETGNANGLVAGPGNVGPTRVPSRCTRLPERYCHRDADCDLLAAAPGQNGVCGGDGGVCSNASKVCGSDAECGAGVCWKGTLPQLDLRSDGLTVQGNDFAPGLATGIRDNGSGGSRFIGNRVTGATVAALALSGGAVLDATVRDNVLTGSRVGLAFLTLPTAEPRLTFRRNDITGSTVRALSAPAGWTAPLLLSRNYWGRPCPEGFRPLPPPPTTCTLAPSVACVEDAGCAGKGVCGTVDADAPNAYLFDDAPACTPVARATCEE